MNQKNYAIPAALILAGLIIAGAIIYSNQSKLGSDTTANSNQQKGIFATDAEIPDLANKLKTVRPVTASDHIEGNINAPLKLIVFGDLECPACKYFDGELQKIQQDYASTSQVAIVYRNFPLTSIHPEAMTEALTAECVNGLAGNDKYWQYINTVYAQTSETSPLPVNQITSIATGLGVNATKLKACVDSKQYQSVIDKDSAEAISAGALGTPYIVIIAPNGDRKAIFGGVPAETLKPELDKLLAS